jgi:hypothetical protein
MKAQRGSSLSSTSVLDGTGGERHATGALPAGKRPGTHLKKFGGPQCLYGPVRKISPPPPPPPEFDPWTVQPVAHDGILQLNYVMIWNVVILCFRSDNVNAHSRPTYEFKKWMLYFLLHVSFKRNFVFFL